MLTLTKEYVRAEKNFYVSRTNEAFMHMSDERPRLCYSAIFYFYIHVCGPSENKRIANECVTLLRKTLLRFRRYRNNAMVARMNSFEENVYILSSNLA